MRLNSYLTNMRKVGESESTYGDRGISWPRVRSSILVAAKAKDKRTPFNLFLVRDPGGAIANFGHSKG